MYYIYTSVIITAEEQGYIDFYLKRCFACALGFYSTDNISCLASPKGQYKNTIGNQPCLSCPKSKTTISKGSQDIGACSIGTCLLNTKKLQTTTTLHHTNSEAASISFHRTCPLMEQFKTCSSFLENNKKKVTLKRKDNRHHPRVTYIYRTPSF
ncbi:signal peptide, CUB and EGF domain-containing protein 2 [Biomphalaria glabrata]|nr:signal peptide, CUB and EGF domain-containing protein 2 [Biomphalaria glabrata]